MMFAPVAQKVEHMTFNHGVRSSTLRWITKTKATAIAVAFVLAIYHLSRTQLARKRNVDSISPTGHQQKRVLWRTCDKAGAS